jgi:hypothetical protein
MNRVKTCCTPLSWQSFKVLQEMIYRSFCSMFDSLVNHVRTKNFLFWVFLIFLMEPAPAQTGLFNPIPRSVNIDLANVNAKEYKARIKQYKDTLRSLGRLEKQALVRAKKS